jgi:hypothetical protein
MEAKKNHYIHFKTKKIKFESIFDFYIPIVSAKLSVPQWYKDIRRWVGDKPKIYPNRNTTMKHCIPLFDAITAGYQITLPFDLIVEQINNKPNLTWLGDSSMIVKRSKSIFEPMSTPVGFSSEMYGIVIPLSFSLPKGYSFLFTQPMNRFDLPTMTMSAIVDADIEIYAGEAPLFIKDGFEGIIEQGTPIAQIIPFKRENWKAVSTKGLNKKAELNKKRSISVISGWYKLNGWKRKSYK